RGAGIPPSTEGRSTAERWRRWWTAKSSGEGRGGRHPRFRLFLLREEFVGGGLSLFVTLLFHLLVDPPFVAERIDDLAVASSPEHVLHGHAYARTGSHRAGDNPICIVNQERDADACSPER